VFCPRFWFGAARAANPAANRYHPHDDSMGGTVESLTESVAALLRFAEQLLKAGSTAYEARHTLRTLAAKMGIEKFSIDLDFRSIAATAQRGHHSVTAVHQLVLPGVHSTNLRKLQSFARYAPHGLPAQRLDAASKLAEANPHAHPTHVICLAVGLACGAFAFLNGSGLSELVAVIIAGTAGQWLRSMLVHKGFKPYGIYAICGLAAAGAYVLLFNLLELQGARVATGMVSSVLFLVPGFPMITGALDLLHYETQIAMSRLTHVLMMLLMAALGMSVVVGLADVAIGGRPTPELSPAWLVAGRLLASFVGAFGFAVLFNGSWRNAVWVGVLAIVGNGLRLVLRDAGLPLPLCTFIGALVIGLSAALLGRWVHESRISLTVAPSVMMVPGVYTFETLVYLNRGNILAGLQSGVLAGFVIGAMGLGLALASFIYGRRS
jgi:uncharacterized membrane protein YjjP (DUF1212 family)